MSANPLSITGGTGLTVPASFPGQQVQPKPAGSQGAVEAYGVGFPKSPAHVADRPNTKEPGREADNAKASLDKEPAFTLDKAAETFKEYVNNLPPELRFNFHEDAKRLVFKIVNPVTGELLRQYPPDEFLEMVKRLSDASKNLTDNGILIDDRF